MAQPELQKSRDLVTLFSPIFERANLFLPILCLALIVVDVYGLFHISGFDRRAGFFLSDVVFLNQIHVVFSLALLMLVPDFKVWLGADKHRRRFFILRSFAVMLAVFLTLMDWIPFFSRSQIDPRMFKLGVAFFLVAQVHHILSQSLGLSLMYNSKARQELSLAWCDHLRFLETCERRLCRSLMWLKISALLIFSIAERTPFVIVGLSTLYFLLAAGLLAVAFSYPREFRNKKLFMMRFLIFPFGPFSFLALIGAAAIHGFESLCVFWKLQTAWVETNRFKKFRVAAASGALISIYTCVSILGGGAHGYGSLVEFPKWKSALWAFSLSATFRHYHVDSFLFRMKDSSTRKLIGALLVRSKAS